MMCVGLKTALVASALGCVMFGCDSRPPVTSAEADGPFGDSVAFDAALSWVGSPGHFTCPAAWTNDTYGYTLDLIRGTGVRHVRERLRWREVAPTRDAWKPGRYLANAKRAEALGIRLGGMFHDAAKWANPSPLLPQDPVAVYDFCKRLAETFGERMEMWEFWNEEDIGFTKEPVWEYAAMMKAAAHGFRAGGFGGLVAPGALCRSDRNPYDDTLLANDVLNYADVFNFHCYMSPSEYPRIFSELRKLLARHGAGDLAVVLTECGTNQEGNSERESVMKGYKAHSPEQEKIQEEFVVKSQVLTRMEGVMRNYFFVFGAYSERGGTKDWGLIRRDGTVKPAVAAYRRLMEEVGAGTLAGEVAVPGGKIRAFRFDMPTGETKLAYWKRSEIDDSPKEIRQWTDEPAEAALRLADGRDFRLVAHRRADYVTLPASVPVARPPRSVGRVGWQRDDGLDYAVILNAKPDAKDYVLGGNKSRLELKRESLGVTLEVWNLDDCPKTGQVLFEGGGRVEGLPESVTLPARGKVEFRLKYVPTENAGPGLVFVGKFGGRRTSRLTMPVFSESKIRRSCEMQELGWKDLKRWTRNTSGTSFACEWDEREQAVRFRITWPNKAPDRWFFPRFSLDLPSESLARARLLTYEVKSAQDKVENDYRSARMYIGYGKGRSAKSYLCAAPTGDWEPRRQEITDVIREGEPRHFEFGGHPKGNDVTYWIRNIRIYNEKR